MLPRIVTISLCVAAISSACGGGGGNKEAQPTDGSGVTQASDERPAYTETCITGMTAFASGGFSEADARKIAEGFCSQAAYRGLLSDKDATWSELAPALQRNLDLLDPLCVRSGSQLFERLPPAARADIEVTSAEWGRQFCRAFFDSDYVGADGALSPSELSRFIQDHPDLYSPFAVAGLMAGYDNDPWVGVSRATFRRVAERAASEAFARGLATARTLTDYESDQERFKEIFLDALQNTRRNKPGPPESTVEPA
jgi:hypothetical protein